MPTEASTEVKQFICKIHKHFKAEASRKAPFYRWDNVEKRTCHALGIHKSLLHRILNMDQSGESSGSSQNAKLIMNIKKNKEPDNFDEDVIRRELLKTF